MEQSGGIYRQHRNAKCVHCGHIGFDSRFPDEPAQHPNVCFHCVSAGRTMPITDTAPVPSPFDRAEHCRQIGTLGGQQTVRIYGVAFMREIARAGFATTCERYYGGNRAHASAALHQRKPHWRTIG